MKKMKLILDRIASVISLLVVVGLFGSGCTTAPEPDFFTSPPPTVLNPGTPPDVEQRQRFQVGDMVVVTFSGVSEPIPAHVEQIKEDGNITLPLIGAVKAVEKTTGELQKEIHGLYVPKYYVRLTVTVTTGQQEVFYVTGEVRVPGPKPYSAAGVTVTQAISAAGGPTEFARKSRVQLKRANGTTVRVDYDKAVRDPKMDPKVFPGDSVHIPRRWL
jgi:polysaccharide export outer membrane protein